jgi:tetratricopeptide (TPR) repeat protein
MVKAGISADKIWLVRSATRILGPFNIDEIQNLLLTRQISIIDEIRSTKSRWSYIRENKDFAEIVKKVREQLDTLSENTMTQSAAYHTTTRSETVSSTLSEDLTPTPPGMYGRRAEDKSGLRDVTPVDSAARSGGGQAKSYGSHSDLRVQQKISGKNSFLRWVIFGIVGVVLVVAGVQLTTKEKRTAGDYDGLMKRALRYRSLGLYDDSLKAYKKATALREADFESQVRMAPVLISVERQTLAGRRLLEKSLTINTGSRTQMVETYNALGLSYLLDGDLRESEVVLQKSLGFEQNNFEAHMNMAIVRMRQGRAEEALQGFTDIVARTGGAPLAVLGQALTAIEIFSKNQNGQSLSVLQPGFARAKEMSGYLRQELALLKISAEILSENENKIQEAVVQFLAEPSGESAKYVRNLLIDTRMTQWDYLEKYCADIYARRSSGAQMKALRAICLMEVNRDGEAMKFIDEALAESPSDPYILITQASYLKKMGRMQEAMALLKRPELSSLLKKSYLMGEICLAQKDLECLHNVFNELYSKNYRDAYTMSGLAWLADQGADRARTYEYIRIGLKADNQYIPLLQLRDKLESE